MIRGHEKAEHEDDGPSWQTLFEAPSETEKFAAIEALFAAAGIDLPATQGAGPHVFDADPAVTFVRLDGGRNLVLFAPSLGHAVSALPEANAEKPEELAFVINYPEAARQEDRDIRDAAQAFVSGQHLAGAISLATSRVAVTLLAIGERPQHFTFARNFANGSLVPASAAPAHLPPPHPPPRRSRLRASSRR